MNADDREKINNQRLIELHDKLRAEHSPIKPRYGVRRLHHLGLIIARFQRLENTILSFLYTLMGTRRDTRVQLLAAELSFDRLLAAVSAIVSEVFVEDVDDIQFVLRQAAQAEQVRDQLVRSAWVTARKRDGSGSDAPQAVFETCTEMDLTSVADWIDRIDTAADALLFRYLERSVPQP